MKECTITNVDIEQLYIKIGKNVKKYREEAKMTQLELAFALGHKSVGTISTAEVYLNKKHFNIEHLAKIANILDKDIKEFFE